MRGLFIVFIRLNSFYLSLYIGTFAILWWLLWFVLVKECPQEDRFIKRTELDYISACLGTTSNLHVLSLYIVFSFVTCFHLIKFIQTRVIPWKAILTSLPVWACVAAHFAENWGFYTLLTQLPTFLSGKLSSFL